MNSRALSFLGWVVISVSLLMALILTVLPLPEILKDFRPAFLLLFILAWIIRLPHRVGIGVAWLNGLMLDSLQGILLGENAVCFTILAYLVFKIQRWICLRSYFFQMWVIFFLLLINQVLLFWFQGLQGTGVSFKWFFGTAISSAIFGVCILIGIQALIKKYKLD